jgi:hypothetical protein
VETGEAADALYYLKDWHHVAQFPSYGAYDTPPWFRDDWLNWAHDATARERVADAADDATDTATEPAVQCADYRFVYLGPAGSFTALHSARARPHPTSIHLRPSSFRTRPSLASASLNHPALVSRCVVPSDAPQWRLSSATAPPLLSPAPVSLPSPRLPTARCTAGRAAFVLVVRQRVRLEALVRSRHARTHACRSLPLV